MVVGTLVILRGGHGLEVLAVHERKNRDLGAGEELLDDDARTGTAEGTARRSRP